mgnify:CR=1 FL=1
MSKNINLTLRAANSWKSRDACKLSNKVTFFTIAVLSLRYVKSCTPNAATPLLPKEVSRDKANCKYCEVY